MFVVDTNLLLYAAIKDFAEHHRCRALLESWRQDPLPWHMGWTTVYEFLRVSTHPAVFEHPWSLSEAWRFLQAATAGPGFSFLRPTDRHAEVVGEIIRLVPQLKGNIVHDLHLAALMREHGIQEIRTADTDFHVFPFLRVVNPLHA